METEGRCLPRSFLGMQENGFVNLQQNAERSWWMGKEKFGYSNLKGLTPLKWGGVCSESHLKMQWPICPCPQFHILLNLRLFNNLQHFATCVCTHTCVCERERQREDKIKTQWIVQWKDDEIVHSELNILKQQKAIQYILLMKVTSAL